MFPNDMEFSVEHRDADVHVELANQKAVGVEVALEDFGLGLGLWKSCNFIASPDLIADRAFQHTGPTGAQKWVRGRVEVFVERGVVARVPVRAFSPERDSTLPHTWSSYGMSSLVSARILSARWRVRIFDMRSWLAWKGAPGIREG